MNDVHIDFARAVTPYWVWVDIDGGGKRWRLVSERTGDSGETEVFFDCGFSENRDAFFERGKYILEIEPPTHNPEKTPDQCAVCGSVLDYGYGPAAGGYGAYKFCPGCEQFVWREQDLEE